MIETKTYCPPRMGMDIKAAELRENNVYIETARGDIWRVSIEFDGQPIIELLERN